MPTAEEYLAACLRLSGRILDEPDNQRPINLGEELAENFRRLDELLRRGEPLPKQWRKEP